MNRTKIKILRDELAKKFGENFDGVRFADALLEDDEPVKEEIRPKAGELWKCEETKSCVFFYTDLQSRTLAHIYGDGSRAVGDNISGSPLHFTRLYPPVEGEK